MTLKFNTVTHISITGEETGARERGMHAGYNILESAPRNGLGRELEYIQVRLGQFEYDELWAPAKRVGIELNQDGRAALPKVLPAYAIEGTAPAADKLVPGEKAVLTAVILEHPVYDFVEKTIETKRFGFFKKSETQSVREQVGSYRELVIDFIMDNLDYSGRTGGSRIQMQLREPTDAVEKREFEELTAGLAKLGKMKKGDLTLANPEHDVLIQPTLISTRMKGNPALLRPDAFAGMLERTNRVVRGTHRPDEPVVVSAAQLMKMIQNDLGVILASPATVPRPSETIVKHAAASAPSPRSKEEILSDQIMDAANIIQQEAKTRHIAGNKLIAVEPLREFSRRLNAVSSRVWDIGQDGLGADSLDSLKETLDKATAGQPKDFKSPAVTQVLADTRAYIEASEIILRPELAPNAFGVPSRAALAKKIANSPLQPKPPESDPHTPMHRHRHVFRPGGR